MESYPAASAWDTAEAGLARGAEGRTVKLVIGGHDLYAKLAFAADRPIYVELTISRGAANGHGQTAAENELETRMVDDARAQLGVICRQASTLLQLGAWGLDDLTQAWRGTKFEPSGLCPQVQGIASSPLDAVARYLDLRLATGSWVPPHH